MVISILILLSVLNIIKSTETQVNYYLFSVILNVHGNVMILTVPLSVTQFVNPPSATLHALNLKTPFAMLNVKNLNVKYN
jgi:hypothetical protein